MKHTLMCAESRTSEREVEEMLAALDLDNDGKVNMEDFVRLLVSEQQRNGGNGTPDVGDQTACEKCVIL